MTKKEFQNSNPSIKFEIPSWAFGRQINIFAGNELLAQKIFVREKIRQNDELIIKEYYRPLKIKAGENNRCNGCGDCCSTGGSPFAPKLLKEIQERLRDYEWQGTGTKCPLLAEDGCSMKGSIPFSCAKSNCQGWSKNCTEQLIELEGLYLKEGLYHVRF